MPDVPQELVRIIKKCIEFKPSDRYETVDELKAALENITSKEPIERTSIVSFRDFLFPGFRTGTIWKMLLATPTYLFVFWLSLSLEVKDTYGSKLWVQRIACLMMFLSMIFATCNYLNIQNILPLCKNKYRIIRYLGVLLLIICFMAQRTKNAFD